MLIFRTPARLAAISLLTMGTALAEPATTRLAQYGQSAPPIPAAPAPAPPAEPEAVRLIQAELLRLGCGVTPDGRWNEADRQAVDRFNQLTRGSFDPYAPTPALFVALRQQEHPICSPSCQPGFEPRDSGCVAVAPPPAAHPRGRAAHRAGPVRQAAPSRQERRAAERERRRAERAQGRERRAERPARERPARERPARAAERRPARRAASGRPGGTDARGCRFVPRASGGGYHGDTVEVCN